MRTHKHTPSLPPYITFTFFLGNLVSSCATSHSNSFILWLIFNLHNRFIYSVLISPFYGTLFVTLYKVIVARRIENLPCANGFLASDTYFLTTQVRKLSSFYWTCRIFYFLYVVQFIMNCWTQWLCLFSGILYFDLDCVSRSVNSVFFYVSILITSLDSWTDLCFGFLSLGGFFFCCCDLKLFGFSNFVLFMNFKASFICNCEFERFLRL